MRHTIPTRCPRVHIMNRTYHHATNDLKQMLMFHCLSCQARLLISFLIRSPPFLAHMQVRGAAFKRWIMGNNVLKTRLTELHIERAIFVFFVPCSRSSTDLGPRLRFRDFTSYSRPAIDALHRQPTCKPIVRQRTMQINASCFSMCRRDTGRIIDLFLCTAQAGEVLAKTLVCGSK